MDYKPEMVQEAGERADVHALVSTPTPVFKPRSPVLSDGLELAIGPT